MGVEKGVGTCEYPTSTSSVDGHCFANALTALITAVVPCCTEFAYETPPHEDCPPQAGYTMASEVAPLWAFKIEVTTGPAEP